MAMGIGTARRRDRRSPRDRQSKLDSLNCRSYRRSMNDDSVRAARELRVVVGRLRRRLREVSATGDLTPSQTSVLSRLGQDGAASASDLAAAERVRPQSMAASSPPSTSAG